MRRVPSATGALSEYTHGDAAVALLNATARQVSAMNTFIVIVVVRGISTNVHCDRERW